jgi:Tol biopolymer transport system component
MTTERHLERDLPQILGDLAVGSYPDYIDDVLATTAHRRQRPAWTFPERWLPMDLATKARHGVPHIPWRIVGLLALLLILLAAMLAFVVGSPRRVPEPFGRATNGSIAYAAGGDIYTLDPQTGTATAIVVSPETEVGPTWSLDGTRVVFERKVGGDAGPGWLMVADEDGRGLVRVTQEPLRGLSGWSFSPDGHSIVALANGDNGTVIVVLPSDGRGEPKVFDLGLRPEDGPPRFRPDGSEIMFNAQQFGAAGRGIYALDPASGEVRTIVAESATADIHAATWSPDGSRIAYSVEVVNAETPTSRTHVVAADGSGDIAIDAHPDSIVDAGDQWSNDGTRLVIHRIYENDRGELRHAMVVVPIDRSSVGVEIECVPDAPPDDCTADWRWSPDDATLLGTRSDGSKATSHFLADPLTGRIRPAPLTAIGPAAWQRVAP